MYTNICICMYMSIYTVTSITLFRYAISVKTGQLLKLGDMCEAGPTRHSCIQMHDSTLLRQQVGVCDATTWHSNQHRFQMCASCKTMNKYRGSWCQVDGGPVGPLLEVFDKMKSEDCKHRHMLPFQNCKDEWCLHLRVGWNPVADMIKKNKQEV